jgi:hypothetical protein
MTGLLVASLALVLASLADVASTRAGLRTGRAYERNPLMRWATATLPRALAVKTFGLAVTFWQLLILAADHRTLAVVVAWLGAIWTARLAYHNFQLVAVLTGSSCVTVSPVRDSAQD